MIGKSQTSPGLYCGLSGLLLVLVFAPIGWSWCGCVALGPAWLVLRDSASVQRGPMRYGYLVGLIFVIGNFWWIAGAVPLGFVFMVAVLSFYPALWFLLVARLLPPEKTGEPYGISRLLGRTILASAFWVTLEWLRSWFLTGFNWNELGVSQTPNLYIRQLAALGGVPLISFVLVLASLWLTEIWRAWRTPGGPDFRKGGVLSGFVLALVAATYLYGECHTHGQDNRLGGHSVSYACIQPDIPRIPYQYGQKTNFLPAESSAYHALIRLTADAISPQPPDLLIWPEAITQQRWGIDSMLSEVVKAVRNHFHGDFLMGAEELEGGRFYSCAYLFRPGALPVESYRKMRLVVFSEYLPWHRALPGMAGFGFTPGEVPVVLGLSHDSLHVSAFICFEETQPDLVAEAARLDPDFFVVLTNDSWFTGFAARWAVEQQLQNGLLRTVEHRRPMIRCANNGVSCEIDAEGKIDARVQGAEGGTVDVPGVLSRELLLSAHPMTFYERWGDWCGIVTKLLTLFAAISAMRFRKAELKPLLGIKPRQGGVSL